MRATLTGGLFTSDQFDRKTGTAKDLGQPSRGVIEVKAPAEPVDDTATTLQITKYWGRYKLVLVTNLRDWLLLGERSGQRVTLERFSLAPDEATFWALASHPTKAQIERGEAFEDFLARVLQHNAPLAAPKDLAFLLASYAREARHRLEHAGEAAVTPLVALKTGLEKALLDEKRPDYFPQVFQGNIYMVSQQKPRRDWSVPQVIRSLGCLDLMDRGATCIPLRTRSVMNADETAHDNVSQLATRYLESVSASAEDLFFHSVALMHSPAYASDNLGGLAQDWPRIPLPESREALLASAALGHDVAALLDTEAPVPGVTSGTLRPEIKTIAVVSRVGGGALKPEEFALTAGWGSGGNGKPVMPGVGRIERNAAEGHPHPNPLPEGEGVKPAQSLDVYLNAKAYWKNVPRPV